MWRVLAFTAATFLLGCTAPAPPATLQPTTSPDMGTIAKQLQDKWDRCLNRSYPIAHRQTPDNDAAAEMAFQACSSEEHDLASLPVAAPVLPHLKAATKQVLVEKGYLP
jgi:hypothetical protein